MKVSDAIQFKRAIRQFSEEPVSEESAQRILNAGRRAQSAKNRQQWHFIALQEREGLEALAKLGAYAGHLAGAALGIAILTPPPSERFSVMFDAGQAAAYMQLAAWELGIGSCLATIYEQDRARELLGYPEELHLNIAISFGYPQDGETITRPPQGRGRNPLTEIVHWERW